MNDEMTREERIREAEARQEELHAEGGTIDERVERLDDLRDRILNGQATDEE